MSLSGFSSRSMASSREVASGCSRSQLVRSACSWRSGRAVGNLEDPGLRPGRPPRALALLASTHLRCPPPSRSSFLHPSFTLFRNAGSNVIESAAMLMESVAAPHEHWAELGKRMHDTEHADDDTTKRREGAGIGWL